MAIAAAREGIEVTVIERAQPPIDKPCGEGIMPDGLVALRQLGVSLGTAAGVPFEGIHFIGAGCDARAHFRSGSGLGIRRTQLHRILAERAAEEGVQVHWGTSVERLTEEYVEAGARFRYRWLVCADGQNSRMRRFAGLDFGHVVRSRYGYRRHYRAAPWSRDVEVHWGRSGQIYVTPTAADEVCVAFITSTPQLRLKEALAEFPQVEKRLSGCTALTREQGSMTSTASFRAVQKGRISLLGEASASVDAITGEGLSTAFKQAAALVRAIKENDLELYEREHRSIMRRPRAMARLLLLMDQSPRIRRRALHALSADSDTFSRLLAIHTGVVSPLQMGLQGALSFGWGFMTA